MGTNEYIISEINLEKDIVILNVVPKNGTIPKFKPGQYVMLSIYKGDGEVWQSRAFSICSSPDDTKYLQFAIRIHGEFTKRISILKKGDMLGVSIPQGFFTFNEARMKKIVFIAGGIGITPFMSALRYVTSKGLKNEITLLYSNRTKDGIIFFEELKQIQKENKNVKIIYTLTDTVPADWNYESGFIDYDMIKRYCSPFDGKYFSLCGPPRFMESISSQLKESGVENSYINIERFI